MLTITNEVKPFEWVGNQPLQAQLRRVNEPVILRGLVDHWPAVHAAQRGDSHLLDYLSRFDAGVPIQAFYGPPEMKGRFFYQDDIIGKNFTQQNTTLAQVLSNIMAPQGSEPHGSHYMGSTTLEYCLPGFTGENPLALGDISSLASIWVGDHTRIAAHYDVPDNIACVVSGKRQFILFPPEQIDNLYVGPLDNTPAGQSISLVDVEAPDFEQHPKFRAALKHAQVAELGPGDAIFIPSMWWHYVAAKAPINVLVNFWWRTTPAYHGLPSDALHHAILSIRDLPKEQRMAWRHLFDHYVFHADETTSAHIPPNARGILGDIDECKARQVKAKLLQRLNR